jgi:hypothetical protein
MSQIWGFHPVANLFPLLQGQAFQDLVDDIRKNGLREPILVDAQKLIIDGRNRYNACLKAGVEPRFEEWKGEGTLEEVALSRNLYRRHLNESQRALVGARLMARFEEEAAKRRGSRTDIRANLPTSQFGPAREKAGIRVNVSPRSITNAQQVLRNGCDRLIAAVDAGGLKISAAARLAGLPKDDQVKALAGGAKHASRRARQIRGSTDSPGPGYFGRVRQEGGEDIVAFLWVTATSLRTAFRVLRESGFRDGKTKAGGVIQVEW